MSTKSLPQRDKEAGLPTVPPRTPPSRLAPKGRHPNPLPQPGGS